MGIARTGRESQVSFAASNTSCMLVLSLVVMAWSVRIVGL